MADALLDPLIRRWIFPMIKTGRTFIVPMGEALRAGLATGGEYDERFPGFLARFLRFLAEPGWAPGSYYAGGWYRRLTGEGTDPLLAEPTPEALRPFYRDELRVDAAGKWRLGRRPIRGRVLRFFLQNLDFDPELQLYRVRYPLGVEEEVQYIHHESPPLRVERLDARMEPPGLRLNDGSEEPLATGTLRLDRRERLYCTVKAAGLTAEFGEQARWQVLSSLEEEDGRFFVTLGGRRVEIPLNA